MTMPHQMNCPHSADGWCLNCVAELAAERDVLLHLLEQHDVHSGIAEVAGLSITISRRRSGRPWFVYVDGCEANFKLRGGEVVPYSTGADALRAALSPQMKADIEAWAVLNPVNRERWKPLPTAGSEAHHGL